MSNLIRKNENSPSSQLAEWEPLRAMRDWLRFDPFREMQPFFARLAPPSPDLLANFDIKESKDGFTFHADVPGVKESDLEITLTGNRLSISGKREAEKTESTDTYYAFERSHGSFSRTFTLPDGVDTDHIRSDLKDGVLTVVVPKRAEAQPKKIQVKPTTPNKS
jgi:HSP20 family protein